MLQLEMIGGDDCATRFLKLSAMKKWRKNLEYQEALREGC